MNPIGPVNALYPMPTPLVGATVNRKPNLINVALAIGRSAPGAAISSPQPSDCRMKSPPGG